MNIQDFFIKWKDKYCDSDGAFGPQCVDIVKEYFKDVLNRPVFVGNAIDYWNNPPTGFKKIPNTFFSRPSPGDLVIWDTKYSSPYGHIGICNWWSFFQINCFEQNDPLNSPCHFNTKSYYRILGFLRPIPQPQPIKWPIAFIGLNLPQGEEFIQKVTEYTSGKIIPVIRQIKAQIPSSVGAPPYDQCIPFLQKLDLLDCKSAFIFYPANQTSTFDVATYWPERNLGFATLPVPTQGTILVHEMIHMLRKNINFNHLAVIEDIEHYPDNWADSGNYDNPGWQFLAQYQEIVKALKL